MISVSLFLAKSKQLVCENVYLFLSCCSLLILLFWDIVLVHKPSSRHTPSPLLLNQTQKFGYKVCTAHSHCFSPSPSQAILGQKPVIVFKLITGFIYCVLNNRWRMSMFGVYSLLKISLGAPGKTGWILFIHLSDTKLIPVENQNMAAQYMKDAEGKAMK